MSNSHFNATKKRLNQPHQIRGMVTRSYLEFTDANNKLTRVYLQHDQDKQYPSGGVGTVKQAIILKDPQKYAVKLLGRVERISDLSKKQVKKLLEVNLEEYLQLSRQTIEANQILNRKAFCLVREEKVYLFTPWIENSAELNDLINNTAVTELPFSARYDMAFQLLEQVNLFHEKDYIHGDIKCENVMWTLDCKLYLIDLDSVRKQGTYSVAPFTPDYLDDSAYHRAVIDKRNIGKHQDKAGDVYALGMTLLGMFPEMGQVIVPNNLTERVSKFAYNDLAAQVPSKYLHRAMHLRQLIATMLSEYPDDRPTIAMIFAEKNKIDSETDEKTEEVDVGYYQSGMQAINNKDYQKAFHCFEEISETGYDFALKGLGLLAQCPVETVAFFALREMFKIHHTHDFEIIHRILILDRLYEKVKDKPPLLTQWLEELTNQADVLSKAPRGKAAFVAICKLLYRHYDEAVSHATQVNQAVDKMDLQQRFLYLFYLATSDNRRSQVTFIKEYLADPATMKKALDASSIGEIDLELFLTAFLNKLAPSVGTIIETIDMVHTLNYFLKSKRDITHSACIAEYFKKALQFCESQAANGRIISLLEELKHCDDKKIAASAKTLLKKLFDPVTLTSTNQRQVLTVAMHGNVDAMNMLADFYNTHKKPGKATLFAFCSTVFGGSPTVYKQLEDGSIVKQGFFANNSHRYLITLLNAFLFNPQLLAKGLDILNVQHKLHLYNPIKLVLVMEELFKQHALPKLSVDEASDYSRGSERLHKAVRSVLDSAGIAVTETQQMVANLLKQLPSIATVKAQHSVEAAQSSSSKRRSG